MIYFIEQVPQGPVKIGYSRSSPAARLIDIQIGNPSELKLLGVFEGSQQEEWALHHALEGARIRGEWFHRLDALRALRIFRRVGVRGIAAIKRSSLGEERQVRARFVSNERLYRALTRRLATVVIETLPGDELRARTGLDAPSWRNARRGKSIPRGPAFFAAIHTFPRFRRLFAAIPMRGVSWVERIDAYRAGEKPRLVA